MPVQHGMASLEPLGEQLKTEEAVKAAMKIISPQHPNRSDTLMLRSGSDKAGNLCYFEAPIGSGLQGGWKIFRNKTRPETDGFFVLRARQECIDRRGPSGMILHFHVSESQ